MPISLLEIGHTIFDPNFYQSNSSFSLWHYVLDPSKGPDFITPLPINLAYSELEEVTIVV